MRSAGGEVRLRSERVLAAPRQLLGTAVEPVHPDGERPPLRGAAVLIDPFVRAIN
jgi:hypothetical protein